MDRVSSLPRLAWRPSQIATLNTQRSVNCSADGANLVVMDHVGVFRRPVRGLAFPIKSTHAVLDPLVTSCLADGVLPSRHLSKDRSRGRASVRDSEAQQSEAQRSPFLLSTGLTGETPQSCALWPATRPKNAFLEYAGGLRELPITSRPRFLSMREDDEEGSLLDVGKRRSRERGGCCVLLIGSEWVTVRAVVK